MSAPSFREIGAKLGLSASTVSRAFHQDPRISAKTTRRVLAALKNADYQFDPIVSTGMSKIRQRRFYRENIAWCGDAPREKRPWFQPLFHSAETYGARLGYRIEYYHIEKNQPAASARLASIWKARGIRGVLFGPFRTSIVSPAFPWADFSWVLIGRPFENPALHSVGRDYPMDLRTALHWLSGQGCRRICFFHDPEASQVFRHPTLLASLAHYHGVRSRPQTPCFEPNPRQPALWKSWLKENRPDGLILPMPPSASLRRMLQPLLQSLPVVFLSSPPDDLKPRQAGFAARFDIMGQSSVNLLHRLLSNREMGIPSYKQSVLLSSSFRTDGV